MTALKIAKFLGTSPKNSSELLPDTSAQVARNCKLYSGDLIPYPEPVVAASADRSGEIQTLFAMHDPDTNELKWLTWSTDVDIATPAVDTADEQRFYYTGDGVPKVSTYSLATSGTPPYPTEYYDLGLPLPAQTPITLATPFEKATAISFARDGGNNVTLVTSEAHNLKSGAVINVSGFTYRTGSYSRTAYKITVTLSNHGLSTGAVVYLEFTSGSATTNRYTITVTGANTFTCTDTATGGTSGEVKWDIRDLNIIAEVDVVDETTVKYFAPGPEVATTTIIKSGTYSQALFSVTVTIASHGLVVGDVIYLNFTSGTAADETFSVTTVTDANTIVVTSTTSLSTSGTVTATLLTGTVDLGDQVQARTYLYTWYTPWQEESIGSEPSGPLFIREGQIVTVSDLPTAAPSGKNFIRGIRLYRTLSSDQFSGYFLLKTLWFPAAIVAAGRSNNVSTVTLVHQHNLITGDRFKISGCSESSFDIVDGVVASVVDDFSFTYAQAVPSIATATVTGTFYHDAAENDDPAVYWGDGGQYEFTDNFSYRALTEILNSTAYEPPPEGLRGLTLIQNNVLVGFDGRELYFSEPGKYHAWPSQYRRSLEYNIVGLAQYNGELFIMTEAYPYLISGSDPATISQARMSSRYPCTSKRSIAETNFGVVYATHDGLVVFSTATAAQLLTKVLHHSDTWNGALDPTAIVGTFYKDNYMASTPAGGFTLEMIDQGQFSFVDLDTTFTASWYDTDGNRLYMISDETGDIYRWDDREQAPQTMVWKSKTLVAQDYVNLGAARVIADYTGNDASQVWEDVETNWEDETSLWSATDPITFRLFVGKSLLFETERSDSSIFRMPAGYKNDTFEIEIESPVRVRAVHLAETPYMLKTV